jgi:hypothetical protein
MANQRRSFSGNGDKDHLRDLLGPMVIATHLPKRRRIHKIDMPADDFGKCDFGPFGRIALEEFGIFHLIYPILPVAPESHNSQQ